MIPSAAGQGVESENWTKAAFAGDVRSDCQRYGTRERAIMEMTARSTDAPRRGLTPVRRGLLAFRVVSV